MTIRKRRPGAGTGHGLRQWPVYRIVALERRLMLTAAVSFSVGTGYSTPDLSPQTLVTGNFNGDAYPDLVVSQYVGNGTGPGELRVLTGNGNGTFSLSQTISTESVAIDMTVADFNNDGKDDIAAVPRQNNNNRVAILLGNGNGTLAAPVYRTVLNGVNTPYLARVAAGDFNHDNKIDLAVTSLYTTTSILLGNGLGDFPNRISLPPTEQYAVTTAYVNNDNNLDLVTVDRYTSNINVFLGIGNGNFQNALPEVIAGYGENIAAGYFNNDARLDLAVAVACDINCNQRDVSVLIGDGSGAFPTHYHYEPTSYPYASIVTGDFDGDFQTDIGIGQTTGFTDQFAEYFSVLPGTGSGTFRSPVDFAMGNNGPINLVKGDFNLDGKPDIAIATDNPGSIQVFTNTAVFQSIVRGRVWNDSNANTAFDDYESGLAGRTVYDDANNNGAPDAGETSAVTDANGAYQLLLSPGLHRLRQVLPSSWYQTTPPDHTVPGPRLINVGQHQVYSAIDLGATQLGGISGRVFYDIAADTYSDDSDPGQSGFKVFVDGNFNGGFDAGEAFTFTDATGHYSFANLFPGSYAVGVIKPAGWQQTTPDPNPGLFYTKVFGGGGDVGGYVDFGVIHPSFVTGRVFNDADANGTQGAGENGLIGFEVFADINGDGFQGLKEPYTQTNSLGDYSLRVPIDGTYNVHVVRPSGWQSTVPASNTYSVVFSNGSTLSGKNFGLKQGALNNAGFKSPVNLKASQFNFVNPISIATGDFNLDTKQDFVVANNAADITLFTGNGAGGFTASSAGFGGSSKRAIIAAFLNNDNIPDLVTANQDGDSVSVLLGNGNGTFQTSHDYPAAGGAYCVVAADFTGDGKTDLAVGGNSGNQIVLLAGDGNGAFAAPVNIGAAAGALSIATGDFNKDTKMDLAWVNQNSDSVTVLLGNGNGTFKSPALSITTGITQPGSIAVGDFNKDTFPDLAVINAFSDVARIITGKGDGTFNAGVNYPTGSVPSQVVVADIDQDGWLDLAIAYKSDGTTDISGGVNILRNHGDGTFESPLTSTAHTSPTSVGVADFNGDNFPDLAAANFFSDDVSVMINNRTAAIGTIGGAIFNDLNGNGAADAGEAGLAGQTVYIDANDSGALDPGEVSTLTDAAGQFLFPALTPGPYLVRVASATGWTQTTPASSAGQSVSLAAGQNSIVAFGLHDTKAPAVFDAALIYDAHPMNLRVVFDEDVVASLTASDLQLMSLATGQPVPQANIALNYVAATHVATFTFPGYVNGLLPDGDYRATVPAGAVADASGNSLAGPFTYDFFVFAGDANHDRIIDFKDLVAVAQNYGGTEKTPSQGDANGDGKVDFADLVILAQKYNATLPLPAPVFAAAPADAPALTSVNESPAAASSRCTPVFSVVPVIKPRPSPAKPTRRHRT